MKTSRNLQAVGGIMAKGIGAKRLSISALAVGLALGFATPLYAQTNFVVDLADPNVDVDLSVLNDGGLAPQMGVPAPMGSAPALQTNTGGYKAPGTETPVSRLYVKPTSQFKLPPQTKAIEAPAPVVAQKPKSVVPMPEIEPVPESLSPPEPPVASSVPAAPEVTAPTTPPPPPPMAELEKPEPMATPEVAAAPEPAPAAPQKEEVAAILENVPAAPEPEKPVEATPPAPKPAPVEEVTQAEPVEEVKKPVQLAPSPVEDEIKEVAAAPVPPPPPTPTPTAEPAAEPQAALTPPPAPAPVEHDETDTAAMADKVQQGDGTMVIPPKAETEVAAVPPSTGPLSDGQSLRILFNADSSKLPPAARDQLSDIASKMQNQDNMRLQLLAYAANPDMSASAARRLSLSRALAVRSFLIESGVRSTRIDVRALGNKSSDPQTERVDITVVER